jgi:hypothetical protein
VRVQLIKNGKKVTAFGMSRRHLQTTTRHNSRMTNAA